MKYKALFWILLIAILLLLIAYLIVHIPQPTISVDFANRNGGVAVSQNFIGIGGVGTTLSDAAAIKLVSAINLRGNRIWASIDLIYKTQTPDYGLFDQQLDRATADGRRPVIVVQGTPPWMGVSACSTPPNLAQWAQLAAQLIAHIEQRKPGAAQGYEIWNEPDSTSFCSSDPLNDYMKMYAAAGAAIRQSTPQVKIGGPALAAPGPNTATWIPRFVSAPTAQYVDFVSFHLYITGNPNLPHMTWTDLYNQSQANPGGLSYYYRTLESYVRKGSQPNAATTPIYITEYNVNYVYSSNCCQNDPIYGPLWNTVAIVDWLNATNDGAQRDPDTIDYFMAADSKGFFCIMGQINEQMDCKPPSGGTGYKPYPQYLTYQLFTASNYLNLEDGATVLPRPTVPDGVDAAALYTADKDVLILVNPTGEPIRDAIVKLANPGIHAVDGEIATLTYSSLIRRELPLLPTAVNHFAAQVNIPAHATVAITLRQQ